MNNNKKHVHNMLNWSSEHFIFERKALKAFVFWLGDVEKTKLKKNEKKTFLFELFIIKMRKQNKKNTLFLIKFYIFVFYKGKACLNIHTYSSCINMYKCLYALKSGYMKMFLRLQCWAFCFFVHYHQKHDCINKKTENLIRKIWYKTLCKILIGNVENCYIVKWSGFYFCKKIF